MDFQVIITEISIMLVPVLLAITLHEVAHGYVADRMGDHTARLSGRLTLNPIKHLDVIGTLVFFLTRMIGWAKPVPVNPLNLKNPRQDMIWVALAGPMTNLLLAVASSILFRLMSSIQIHPDSGIAISILIPLIMMLKASIVINIALAIFNLIPIPPLDGGRILNGILPARQSAVFSQVEPYGFLIILVLVISGTLGKLIFPIIYLFTSIFL